MDIFDTIEGLMSGAIKASFGTRLRVLPQREGKVVVGGADPSRPVYEVRGVLDHTVTPALPQGSGSRDGNMSTLSAPDPRATISKAALGSNEPPGKGDLIQALDRAGQPLYRVSNVLPLGTTDLIFILTVVAR